MADAEAISSESTGKFGRHGQGGVDPLQFPECAFRRTVNTEFISGPIGPIGSRRAIDTPSPR
ncbi:MAG: hypothetical protein ACREFU_01605 [Acetobacteraceae bacterium]